jgi:hypothetical protein
MDPPSKLIRAESVGAADWIISRLGEFGTNVASVVPGGFEAYARVLHPADAYGPGGPVRWGDVAKWSGLPLRSSSQFHSIALPPEAPPHDAPWDDGPRLGTLTEADALRLVDLLRPWTTTPNECWFALWDGYGWQSRLDPSEPRVHLPSRDYLLYAGPIEAVGTADLFAESGHTPNLWWPADDAWCVASEIDLAWTYVGGSTKMLDQLVSDTQIEALAIGPDAPIWHSEPWVDQWVDEAVDELLTSGESTVVTPMGTVVAHLTPPGRIRDGWFRTVTSRSDGSTGGNSHRLGKMPPASLRQHIASYLTRGVVGLVEH